MTTLQHQYLSVDVILIDPVQSCSSSTTGTTTAIESRPELPHSSARPTSAPELIVLFAWMDAQLKHVVKYSDHYAAIYPLASILIIRSRQSQFYSLKSSQLKAMQPAFGYIARRFPNPASRAADDAISTLAGNRARLSVDASNNTLEKNGQRKAGDRMQRKERILVHTFSNGGCLSLMRVDELFRASSFGCIDPSAHEKSTGAANFSGGIPAQGFIFDSCPGTTSLPIFVRAFTAAIPSLWLRIPAGFLVGAGYIVITVGGWILRRPDPITTLFDYLNLHLTAPRLYIYSRSDALIPYEAVERHSKTAQQRGISVTTERLEGTAHVAHTRGEGNAARYWNAVQRFWDVSPPAQ